MALRNIPGPRRDRVSTDGGCGSEKFQINPTPFVSVSERCSTRLVMWRAMVGPGRGWSLLGSEARLARASGLASIRSIHSWNAALRSDGEMVRTSIGRLESQSCKASSGRRCENWCRIRVMRLRVAVCASGFVSTQAYD